MLKFLDSLLPWAPSVLNGLLLVYIALRRPVRLRRYAIIVMIIQTVIFITGEVIGYLFGREDKFVKYLYPPYSNDFMRNTMWNLTTMTSGWIAAAILGLALHVLFFRRGQELFITRREFWLIVIGAVVVGWPGVLIFLATIFIISVLGMVGLVVMRKKTLHDRLVITPFIIPSALITLITGGWTLPLTRLDRIGF